MLSTDKFEKLTPLLPWVAKKEFSLRYQYYIKQTIDKN